MKKSLLILLLAAITAGAFAQENKDHYEKNHGDDNRESNHKKYENDDDHDNGRHDKSFKKDKKNKKDNDRRDYQNRQNRNNNVVYKNTQSNGTVNQGNTNTVPSVVTRSFYNDYPAAKGVVWIKGNGYWTASFVKGIFRPTASYYNNGQRRN